MRKQIERTFVFGAAAWLVLPPLAVAEEVFLADPVVVSATRTPIEAAKTGSSISVITLQDLEDNPQNTVAEAIENVPGVAVAPRGPLGSSTEISVRGFDQSDILVRFDGIELADPGELRVQADLGQILLGDVNRIEVLRGAQSALYGGEAIGGVIDITSGAGRGTGQTLKLFGEGGSYYTAVGGATVGFGELDWDLSATAQGARSAGFSAADEDDGATEKDGYDNITLSAVGSVDVTEAVTLGGALRYVDRETQIDRISRGVPVDADGRTAESEFYAARGFTRVGLFEGQLMNEFSAQFLSSTREFKEATDSKFEGDRLKLEYLGSWDVTEGIDFVLGGDWTDEDVETSDGVDENTQIAGGFLQMVFEPTSYLTFTGAGRYDRHSEFGGEPTWRGTAAVQPLQSTVVRGAVATGFRAPSNRELFSPDDPFFGPVGNPNLQPERSFTWEIGVDQSFFSDRARVSATYFQSRTEDLIAFRFGEGFVQIEGDTERRGVELGLAALLFDNLDVNVTYTYLNAEEPNGDQLEFAPRHDVTAKVVWRPFERVTLTGTGTYLGEVRDSGEDLDPFFVLNAVAAYEVVDDVSLYVRVDNILDENYQRVDGFGTSDLAAYAGFRAQF